MSARIEKEPESVTGEVSDHEDDTRTISIPLKIVGGAIGIYGFLSSYVGGREFVHNVFNEHSWLYDVAGQFDRLVTDAAFVGAGTVLIAAGISVAFPGKPDHVEEGLPAYPAPPEYEQFTAWASIRAPEEELPANDMVFLSQQYNDQQEGLY